MWLLPTKELNSLPCFFTWKDNLIFLNRLSICIIKGENNFNSVEMRMRSCEWPSCFPIPWSSLWPHFPISVTVIITGDPRKVNVLVWAGIGSNKKKETGCPEPSTEGTADAALPQAPGAAAAVTVPKSFIFRNWMTASAFRHCKICRYCRNHCGQWKIQVVGTGEGWNKLRKTGSYHYQKNMLFCLRVTEESWNFRSETDLEITACKNYM